MTYMVLVEPADEQRSAFARWCLAQDPPIMTASATGSEVPADLFVDIPDALLDGAHVDGHVFRPVIEGRVPDGDGYRDVVPVNDGAKPEPLSTPTPKTPARRRRTRQVPTGKASDK